MRIGLVELDTSHARAWLPILRNLGHDVIGVTDHADVHPQGYAERFASEHDMPHVFHSLQAVAALVDLAVVRRCDWDVHVERARPFIGAGCAVLIDKPVAGNLHDRAQFQSWADAGARITGGSALRFCPEITAYLAHLEQERASIHTALCGCAVDEFNYGIHAYAMFAASLGPDASYVRHVSQQGQRRIEIRWDDGRLGWLVVGHAANWHPYDATFVSDHGPHQLQAKPGVLYQVMLENVLPYLAGQTDQPPVAPEHWLAPERWAIAARQSWTHHNQFVRLDQIDHATCYDGSAFRHAYQLQARAQARPSAVH